MSRAILGSASRQPLLSKCTGSAVLPRIESVSDAANEGSAIHESLAVRATHGLEASLVQWPDIAARWGLDERETGIVGARLRSFIWCPPNGALVEVGLAMLTDGSVARVEGGRGEYPALPPGTLLPGQADVVWSEPEPLDLSDPARPRCPKGSLLVVGDYKTGDAANVTGADRNEQLLSLGLLWARFTGAEAVRVAAIFPGPEKGTWDTTSVLRAAAFDRIEARIRARHARIEVQREAFARGEHIELVEGPHCTYCPAEAACPAKTARLRALVADGDAPFAAGPLSPELARNAAVILPMLGQLEKKMRAALQAHAKSFGPIDLGNGNVWGPIVETKEEIDYAAAYDVLRDELGPERVQAAAKITKSAIDDAIGALHEERGIKKQKSAAMRRVLARLHEAKAIRDVAGETFKAYRPGASAEAAEASIPRRAAPATNRASEVVL